MSAPRVFVLALLLSISAVSGLRKLDYLEAAQNRVANVIKHAAAEAEAEVQATVPTAAQAVSEVLKDAAAEAGNLSVSLNTAAVEAETVTATMYREHVSPVVQMLMAFMTGISFLSFVKAVCMIGNLAVQLSPIGLVRSWSENNDTGDMDVAPFASMAFGAWQWCFYGTLAYKITGSSGFLILDEANFLGAVLGTIYCIMFYRHCQSKDSLSNMKKYLVVMGVLVLGEIVSLAALPSTTAMFVVGSVALGCSFTSGASVLIQIPKVLKTKDSTPIPTTLCVANFFSAVCWSLCGFLIGDAMVMSPNVVTSMVSPFCLFVKWLYPKNEKAGDAGAEQTES